MLQAEKHYQRNGFRKAASHQRRFGVEIDLIFSKESTLMLVEVKHLASQDLIERIFRSRQLERLKRAHMYYVEAFPDHEVCFEFFYILSNGEEGVIGDFLCDFS